MKDDDDDDDDEANQQADGGSDLLLLLGILLLLELLLELLELLLLVLGHERVVLVEEVVVELARQRVESRVARLALVLLPRDRPKVDEPRRPSLRAHFRRSCVELRRGGGAGGMRKERVRRRIEQTERGEWHVLVLSFGFRLRGGEARLQDCWPLGIALLL
jgi:hypothetical protein